MENTIFGLTEGQIAQFGLTFGVGAFILYMLFIVLNLALEAKAGKFPMPSIMVSAFRAGTTKTRAMLMLATGAQPALLATSLLTARTDLPALTAAACPTETEWCRSTSRSPRDPLRMRA